MDSVFRYFPDLTPRQREQFAALGPLYAEWNARINVVSRKDFDQLYLRHVLHSLAIARVCAFAAGARVLDVGCGGGFPSVPLAILFPEARFTAVDSIGKKITVVRAVAEGAGIANLEARNCRAEQLAERFARRDRHGDLHGLGLAARRTRTARHAAQRHPLPQRRRSDRRTGPHPPNVAGVPDLGIFRRRVFRNQKGSLHLPLIRFPDLRGFPRAPSSRPKGHTARLPTAAFPLNRP